MEGKIITVSVQCNSRVVSAINDNRKQETQREKKRGGKAK
jgi:hypothetical protein